MTGTSPVAHLVTVAQRRSIGNLAARQGALCASAFLLALIVLLILGTQVVAWYWPVTLGLMTAAWGGYRTARRLPAEYDTAQKVDERLGSRDLISTAYHFSRLSEADRPRSRFLEVVANEADAVASGVPASASAPLRWPREAWIALGLLIIAGVMLGVRYGVLHTLDLSAALVEVRFDPFTGAPEPPARKTAGPGLPEQLPPLMAMTTEEAARPEQQLDQIPDDALQTLEVPGESAVPLKAGERKQEGLTSGEEGTETGETGEKSESGQGQDEPGGDTPPSKNAESKKGGQPPKEANSLLDKMRDAFNNLMDKMGMQPKTNAGDQKAGSSQAKQQSPKGEKSDEKGQQMSSKSKGDPNAEADANQPGENSEQAQGNNKSQGDRQEEASNEPRSGMGKQDGKKDTELAEQLEAMGKISEILGKRSTSIAGEMMVEVQNSKQQLRTQYVNRTAAHGEGGGEVNRDEVPLHIQPYVQQYYEQVRKSAPVPVPAKN